MARYNEILVGRFARGIQKQFGVKGEVPVASLAGEMVVSHQLQSGIENRYLEGWDKFAGVPVVAAQGVGNQSGIELRNPANSNVIVSIEKLSIGNIGNAAAGTQVVLIQNTTITDLVGFPGVLALDTRGRPSSTAVLSSGTSPLTAGNLGAIGAPAQNATTDIIWDEQQEILLVPGRTLFIVQVLANTQFGPVTIWWRERFLEESERT